MKDFFEVWEAQALFKLIDEHRGVLKHENDGFIFTVDACPYYAGTCQDIMKWKPMHLNSIDFQMVPLASFKAGLETPGS